MRPPTRSEELRKRHTETSQKRLVQVGQQARRPVPTPSVTVRGVRNVGTPIHERARSRVKRQYYTTSSTGAEVHLPSLPMVQFGWRGLSGLLSAILLAMIIMVYNSAELRVSAIKTSGLKRVQPADISDAVEAVGQQIFMIDPAVVTSAIHHAFPELTDVQVKIAMPNQVIVSGKERTPVLAWVYAKETLWIDGQGHVFPARGEVGPLLTIQSDAPPPLLPLPPVVPENQPNGERPEVSPTPPPPLVNRNIDPVVMDAAIRLSAIVPPETILAYNSKDGLGWQDARGWKVFVGINLDQMDLKLAEYQAIVDHLTQLGIQPTMISVEHVHAPFYRTE